MSGLLILISVITGTASFIALIRPLPGLWLPTRKRAFAVWIVSFLLLGIGTPDSVETPPVIAIEPSPVEPESEPVPEISEPSQVEDMSDAEQLTVIASPSRGERETTQRRFEFLLNRFNEYCPTEDGEASVSDMLVFTHGKSKEAGLDGEESLLDLSNTLHRMTSEIATASSAARMDQPACAEIWSMYLVLRNGGYSPIEARESVAAVAGGLYGLVQ